MNIRIKPFLSLALAALLLTGVGSVLAQKSGIGTITEIVHDEEYMYIGEEEVDFHINELKVTYQDQPVRVSKLQEGLIIRYETDAEGFMISATLLGPKATLDEMFTN